MSFAVGADAYDRFMGRYSVPLAPTLADFAGVTTGQSVLDVGCGPGALTAELVGRLGAARVRAVDPSESFVAAAHERHPGVAVERAAAEQLPFGDGEFDVALAQLVVHFMADPVAGLREMARVTRADGVVAACVWDHAGGHGPLSLFWDAARELDPDVHDESQLAGAREGHLAQLFEEAGMRDVEEGLLSVDVEHSTFDEWWDPFMLGVGPAGQHVTSLDAERQGRLRELCRERLPDAPFAVDARAWAARGVAVAPDGMATFELLHGAWHDPTCWDLVVAELRERGHHAIAPELPLHDPAAGYAQRARPAIDALADVAGPVVIVGHSMGSAYAPIVAAEREDALLVHLCPSLGGFTAPLGAPRRFRESLPFPPSRPDGTNAWDPEVALNAIYARLPQATARALADRLRPMAHPPDDFPLPGHPDVPTVLVYATEDEFFEPDWERFMARELLGVDPIEIAGGHFPMVEDPVALCGLLDRLANDASGSVV